MDTPRLLQVASTVTAIAGLGVGAILLGRPSTEPVATIDIDTVIAAVRETDRQPVRTERAPEIVRPQVIEDAPSAGSPDSLASPEDAAPGSSTAPPPDPTDPTDPTDSAGSADSAGSVDSPSSNGSD